MLLTHMIDKIRPVRDSPPRQYATHPPLVRTRGGVRCRGGGGGGGGPYWNKNKIKTDNRETNLKTTRQ